LAGGEGSPDGQQSSANVVDSLEQTARMLAGMGREAEAAGRRTQEELQRASSDLGEGDTPQQQAQSDEFDAEFSPGPAETADLVLSRYEVGRNLLLRFADDTFTQSFITTIGCARGRAVLKPVVAHCALTPHALVPLFFFWQDRF